jgi:hypothetical protein
MRAFFAEGVDKMHIPWAVGGLPTLLHVSLFLFFGGVVIFLFNVDQEVFIFVALWIVFFLMVYGLITLLPSIRHDSPYHTPLSIPARFLYTRILFLTFKVLAFIASTCYGGCKIWRRCRDMRDRYRGWMLVRVEDMAEEAASKKLSEIDGRILRWTTSALGDDDSLEESFGAIPGFCDSNLVLQTRPPPLLQRKIRQVMDEFLDRTLSSGLVSESTKIGRVTVCLNTAYTVLGPLVAVRTISNIFDGRWRGAPKSIEMGYALRRWCHNRDEWIALTARSIVAGIIAVQRRDDRWIALAEDQFGLPDRVLRDNIPYGDSVLLVIMLQVTRNLIHSVVPHWESNSLRVLSQFDIRNTLPQLQHDFCALWNEISRKAHNRRPYSAPFYILREIRHLYATLHEGTSSGPGFSTSTAHGDGIMSDLPSYPLCNAANHNSVRLPHIHASAAPSAADPHLDPALAHMSRFTGRDMQASNRGNSYRASNRLRAEPSSSDVPDAPRVFVPVAAPFSKNEPFLIPSLAAASDATPGDPDISTNSLTHLMPRPIPRDGSVSQRSEELTIIPSEPSPVVSDSASPPIPMSAVGPNNPADLPLDLESPHAQSEDIPRAPESASSSSPSSLAHPQPASYLDSQTIETTTAQHGRHDMVSSAPKEDSGRSCPSSVADPGISESASRPGDCRRGLNQS